MKQLIAFIETVYLAPASLAAQLMWLKAFRQLLDAKTKEVEAAHAREVLEARIAGGVIEGAEEFSTEEIRLAVEMMREEKKRWPGVLRTYERTYRQRD